MDKLTLTKLAYLTAGKVLEFVLIQTVDRMIAVYFTFHVHESAGKPEHHCAVSSPEL